MSAPQPFDAVHEQRLRFAARTDDLKTPGSFVRLFSGGPIGVITEVMASEDVLVTWLTDPRESSILPEQCVRAA